MMSVSSFIVVSGQDAFMAHGCAENRLDAIARAEFDTLRTATLLQWPFHRQR